MKSQSCTTPVDCYIKAIAVIERDRNEIGKVSEKIQNINIESKKKINEMLDDIKKHIEKEILEKFTPIENSINSRNQRLISISSDLNKIKDSNKNQQKMYEDAIIYQDPIMALETGVINKLGNPIGWDEQTYRINTYERRKMINIGNTQQNNGNGMLVKVPEGYNVLWLRVLNDRENVYRVTNVNFQDEQIEKYACFARGLNEISPDGTTSDSYDYLNKWCPIPLRRPGDYIIYSDKNRDGCWISGLAFSKNIWNHAKNGALAYYWRINGGSEAEWNSSNWNNDVIAMVPYGKTTEYNVPVVASGNDKLLYLVEYNSNWDGLMHTSLLINDKPVERFRTTYYNPFATHINSKIFQRYVAVRVPKEYIANDSKFLNLKINMEMNNRQINFREIGTHDYFE